MGSHRSWLWSGGVFLILVGSLAQGQQLARVDKPEAAKPAPELSSDVRALAARIDFHVNARIKEAGAKAAPLADDSEFCRRIYLDLAGRIPTVAEVRGFLDDKSADKREKLVDQLLSGPAYVNHFINTYRAMMLPEVDANFEAQFLVPGFDAWLRKKVTENTPWNQLVREVVTVPFTGQTGAPQLRPNQAQQGEPTPDSYYLAKEAKPENLAASTARNFLGIRIECAQCHNHPTAQWKQEQFWSFAAFFAGLQRQGTGMQAFAPVREVLDRRELSIPNTERVVQAMFLDGVEPQWKHKVGPRQSLADWMTAPDNPYLARAAANRVWAHLFGVGIVDPVDDMDPENPPSHPELLDELAKELVKHDFDLKFLFRAIAASQAYQRTSVQTDKSQEDPRLFAKMTVKGMTAEMVFDSLATAIGYRDPTPANQRRVALLGAGTARTDLMARFNNQGDKRIETQTSILQALSLMNGRLISDATSLEQSETLAAVVDSPFLSTPQRIETLYLTTLNRVPTADESARLVKYVEAGGPAKDPKKALGDVFWALLNCGEFLLNH